MTPVFNPPKMHFTFDPAGNPDLPWVIDGECTFCDGTAMFRIEDGFRTDLASVPLLLSWMFPPNGSHQRAAVHHDAAYKRQFCTRFTADAGFRTIMAHDNVPAWRRFLMFYGVRLFGGAAWRKHKRNKG